MNPYLQEILHQITVRITELETRNTMLEAECVALRQQLEELERDRNFS